MVLAALVAAIWGLAFVATKIGLESFSPAQLTALRFLIACFPVLVLPRPNVSWVRLLLIGMTLFTGQFLFLFFAFTLGMPPGVASVTQQMQVFFTVMLAAIFLREIPTARQSVGMTVAFVGLASIGLSVDASLTWLGLGLALAGAASWAIGNGSTSLGLSLSKTLRVAAIPTTSMGRRTTAAFLRSRPASTG